MHVQSNPRILLLDIETKPALVYTFGIRDQHINYKQIAQDGGTICVGHKWLGEKRAQVLSDWDHGHSAMIRRTHELISEADAVATYNGASFDIPKLMGDFLLEGLAPPPPPTQIDIYKAVRKLGFICNKLDYIAPLLGLGSKVKHEGLEMWIACMAGDRAAQKRMTKYCAGDVDLLERVYLKVRPYVFNHPHMGTSGPLQCPACNSHQTQSRGVRRTRTSYIQRYQCQACGGWFTGKATRAA